MAFAIIQTGGKQYIARPNETLQIEKLKGEAGDKVSFDKVLLVANGNDIKVGKPTVSGVKVSGVVVGQGKGKKIDILKYKAKSRYRRRIGHRQPYTEVRIETIEE